MAQRVLLDRWTYAETAEVFSVSAPTVRKWVRRHRAEGAPGLEDRSSRPRRSPRITAAPLVTAIQQLRADHGVPAWLIGRALRLPRSTVSAWIRRLGLQRVVAPPRPLHRYEWPQLGDMLHLDIKPLECIGCVGHRIHGDRRQRARGVGWEYVHVRSTTTVAWPTSKSCPINRAPRARRFCAGPSPGGRIARSWFSGS
jgi:hypothetical protein